MGDCVGVQLPDTEIYLGLTNHLGQLSLAVPLWIGERSTRITGNGSSGHHQGRNGEFCVTVGPVTRTAGILA